MDNYHLMKYYLMETLVKNGWTVGHDDRYEDGRSGIVFSLTKIGLELVYATITPEEILFQIEDKKELLEELRKKEEKKTAEK